MSAPTHVTLTLEDRDVQKDMVKVIQDMSKMRAETIAERDITEKQKDEYLHLAYRLASGFKALSDDAINAKRENVMKCVTKNSALMAYDAAQDAYWKNREKSFVQSLDDLLFAVVRDDFNGIDQKHHVLQAVKYLSAEGQDFENRDKIYGTILPFSQGYIPDESFMRKMLGKLFGAQYALEKIDDLKLRAHGSVKHLKELFETAGALGFSKLRMRMTEKEREKIKDKFGGAIVGDDSKKQKIIKGKTKQTVMKYLAANAIKLTLPVSYPLISLLPNDAQEKIGNYIDDYHPFFNSPSGERARIFLGCGGEFAASMFAAAETKHIFFEYFAAEGMARFLLSLSRGHAVGSLPVTVAYDVARDTLESLNIAVSEPFRKNSVDVEFTLRKPSVKEQKEAQNTDFSVLEKLASTPVSSEDNLVWSTENNAQFGKEFTSELFRKTRTNGELEQTVDKKNQLVIFSTHPEYDGYRRDSGVFCSKGKRYLVTAISPAAKQDGFIESATAILNSDRQEQEKVKLLGKSSNARYVHVQKYENGTLTADVEGFE